MTAKQKPVQNEGQTKGTDWGSDRFGLSGTGGKYGAFAQDQTATQAANESPADDRDKQRKFSVAGDRGYAVTPDARLAQDETRDQDDSAAMQAETNDFGYEENEDGMTAGAKRP